MNEPLDYSSIKKFVKKNQGKIAAKMKPNRTILYTGTIRGTPVFKLIKNAQKKWLEEHGLSAGGWPFHTIEDVTQLIESPHPGYNSLFDFALNAPKRKDLSPQDGKKLWSLLSEIYVKCATGEIWIFNGNTMVADSDFSKVELEILLKTKKLDPKVRDELIKIAKRHGDLSNEIKAFDADVADLLKKRVDMAKRFNLTTVRSVYEN
jgi:hypothetical protein